MYDAATKTYYRRDSYVMHRFQIRLCDICIFVHKSEPRVLIGGGEFGFDGLVREADVVEIDSLAEIFGLADLRNIAVQRRTEKLLIDLLLDLPV